MAKLFFICARGSLCIITSKLSYTVPATSGYGQCMNNRTCKGIRNIGPIPTGHYYIFRRDISDPVPVWDYVRNYMPLIGANWDDWRVPLKNCGGGPAWGGRDGFFLHGGRYAGSAGCINIGGVSGDETSNRVLKTLLETEQHELWVE